MAHGHHASVITDPDRLAYLHSLMLLDTPPEEVFDRLTSLAARVLSTPVALLTLVDANRHYFKSFFGLHEPFATTREVDLKSAFCHHVVESGKPLIIEDARQDPALKDNPVVTALNAIAYLGVPLRAPPGFVLGALCVLQGEPRRWQVEEVEILETLAQMAISEFERQREQRLRLEAEEALLRHDEMLQKLARSNADLSQALDLTTDIIRIAGHDLRSPLSVVTGFVQLLREEDELTPEERGLAFDSLDSAINKMQSIVDNILSLERVEALAQRRTERIDLRDMVSRAFQEFQPAAQERQLQLSLSLPETPVYVEGDYAYLAEALTNLVGNAIKYTPAGGKVELCLSVASSETRFEVRDTGFGIPETELDRLFIPFSRITTEETAGIEGTGLGLYLVKSAIERFGGQMVVKSVYGEGSVFGFILPLAPEEPPQ
ncbi:MAG: GAF domain-containing sensor histidine kinase [Chloroflexota bacterium]|nr:MAG: hypothetical protein DIU68_14255 [Chloroflexota bacterium]